MLDMQIENRVEKIFVKRKLSLAVAESCTGGLIGHLITNFPGSSAFFWGGVIAYANEIKINILGVDQEIIDQCGAVSERTVIEMANGVRKLLKTDVGLSISGIAGPGGGSIEKPVGLVWIGISTKENVAAQSFWFSGNRQEVKKQSANKALQLLIDFFALDG